MRSRCRRVVLAACVVPLAVTGIAGCGGSSSTGPGATRPGAAEPATAPPLGSVPAGRSSPVGDGPQGIVFDPRSGLVAVAVRHPDRLQLLDPSSLAVRRTVPLPGSARHLQLSVTGDEVLVPVETANEIVQVPLPSGPVVRTRVLRQPHDATRIANGDVVVGDEFGKALSVVRGGKVVHTFHGLTQPGGVVADGTTVGVVDVGAFTLDTFDLATMRRTGSVPAGAGPTHGVLAAPNRILVADTRGDALLLFSVHPLRRVARLPLAGTPYGLAADSDTSTVWVTLTARNQVVGVRVTRSGMRVIARYPTVRQPDTVAVAPGSRRLWITGTDTGVVQLIRR